MKYFLEPSNRSQWDKEQRNTQFSFSSFKKKTNKLHSCSFVAYGFLLLFLNKEAAIQLSIQMALTLMMLRTWMWRLFCSPRRWVRAMVEPLLDSFLLICLFSGWSWIFFLLWYLSYFLNCELHRVLRWTLNWLNR